jgi:hypothetical protein
VLVSEIRESRALVLPTSNDWGDRFSRLLVCLGLRCFPVVVAHYPLSLGNRAHGFLFGRKAVDQMAFIAQYPRPFVLGDAELAALYSPDQIMADADFFGCPVHRLFLGQPASGSRLFSSRAGITCWSPPCPVDKAFKNQAFDL